MMTNCQDDELLSALSSAEDVLLESLRESRAREAAGLILSADFLLVATGAGMSAGAGLPTYRQYGRDGLSAAVATGVYSVSGEEMSYEDIASPQALREAPRSFHAFMTRFYNLAADAQPTRAYRSLRAWQDFLFPDRSFTFTSNVDGMHLRAGCAGVLECHGSNMRWQCAVPCTRQVWDVGCTVPGFRFPATAAPGRFGPPMCPTGDPLAAGEPSPMPIEEAAASFVRRCGAPPAGCDDAAAATAIVCPHCDGPARPAMLLFGEDHAALHELPEQASAWREWRQRLEAELACASQLPSTVHTLSTPPHANEDGCTRCCVG